MDYGAALKKVTVNPGRKSAHYTKQSPFEGSFRQIRGRIIRTLISHGPVTVRELQKHTGVKPEILYKALETLEKDSMVAEEKGVYQFPK
jgi:A/G-specific adenine glycosylase